MELIADLHLHSHHSIATGREADLEHLDLWGRYKGVQVVGTGDCTHPRWLEELAAKLEAAGPGVYTLKPGLSLPLNLNGPGWEAIPPVRFVITAEVSAIYKKGGRVRKVHLLLLLPSLEAAQKLSQRLGRLGNVTSDGRPILGLDARHILELALEVDPDTLVIPAHIWTPWFSVLGSKSGFDSLEECFEDGLAHIYALETGLSSDPVMNWRISGLDRFRLVSNSDAHSPQKLGREANIFHVPPTYPELARALRTGVGFGGTCEFFPQEGKYHLDGHRQCHLRLYPEESRRLDGLCPQCGKPLTLGVLHRVLELADRETGETPPGAKPFESLIALPEVLGEVLAVGPGSKKVRQRYFQLLEKLGPELSILRRTGVETLEREGGEVGAVLAAAIEKMRRGEVHIDGGYDGAFGEIRLFTAEERRRLQGQKAFFTSGGEEGGGKAEKGKRGKGEATIVPPAEGFLSVENRTLEAENGHPAENRKPKTENDPLLAGLNPLQREAVTHQGAPLLVQAGPGTGKTRTLTHRLAYLVARRGVDPGAVLALAFTRQAAGEMTARLRGLLPPGPELDRVTIKTFHALGYDLLKEALGEARQVLPEEGRRGLLREIARAGALNPGDLDRAITGWKQALAYPADLAGNGVALGAGDNGRSYLQAFQAYEDALCRRGVWDYEDLIARPALLLARRSSLREACRQRFRHLLIDEYQDLNAAQYSLFRSLAGPETGIMAIGDPDQAIYGFRGAKPEYFDRFLADWPAARCCRFRETYRLPLPVLTVAEKLRAAAGAPLAPTVTHQPGQQPLLLLEALTPATEARRIAREIERLVGGFSHLGLEERQTRQLLVQDQAGFRDVAVLYRFHALGVDLERELTAAGIPCQLAREGVGPDWDGFDLAAERVKLLTLHAAKGLEFPYVFIAGCETGLLPWEPEDGRTTDPDEEQRLIYVGLTRASRQVFLSRARVRTLWGRRRRTEFSAWVKAIPRNLLQRPELEAGGHLRARQPRLFAEIPPRRGKRTR
jgi:DNA helicase II / ATP-dependent DNA helicase PcrA